jgi:hypothetical protein
MSIGRKEVRALLKVFIFPPPTPETPNYQREIEIRHLDGLREVAVDDLSNDAILRYSKFGFDA